MSYDYILLLYIKTVYSSLPIFEKKNNFYFFGPNFFGGVKINYKKNLGAKIFLRGA